MEKSWVYVGLTALLELFWVYGFNVASAWWHWFIVLCIIMIDFYCLSKACEKLPTGTVYAIFAGAGTIGTVVMDIVLFNAPFSLMKAVFMVILLAGIIGLKLSDSSVEEGTK